MWPGFFPGTLNILLRKKNLLGKNLRKEFCNFLLKLRQINFCFKQKRQITSLNKNTIWLKFLFACLLEAKNKLTKDLLTFLKDPFENLWWHFMKNIWKFVKLSSHKSLNLNVNRKSFYFIWAGSEGTERHN